jgi:hypothetical protein
VDLRGQKDLLASLAFNRKTRWPARSYLPSDLQPETLLTDAMNPGLGVRGLHRQGLTGKGVRVAIIDQPLPGRHPEYVGKLVAYHDFGSREPTSMHGPAVTSVLVGTQCGTAPEACLYYAACPLSEYAQALEWILDENSKLAPGEKIRVVSVSAAPSGPGSFVGDRKEWDTACQRAEAAGMVVLDCTTHRGFIGCCYYDRDDPETVAKCRSGYPGLKPWPRRDHLLAPGSPRTTAEEYTPGENGYQYCPRGGQSLAVPYCAGVLALGFQVRPEIPAARMKRLLLDSAFVGPDEAKFIDPRAFIAAVKREGTSVSSRRDDSGK